MKKISLVIPTINRKKELDNLLKSIEEQHYNNLEIIIVDQNKKIDLSDLILKYSNKLNINHQKVSFRGAARARNYGMKLANGDIINFPDDDCALESGVLEYVAEHFNRYEEIAIFGKVSDPENSKDILNFKSKDCKVNFSNVYNTTIEASMFILREELKNIGGFDERLGVGEYFGAEEGADLICRLLYKKKKMKYVARIFMTHPSKREYRNFNRAFKYNVGFAGFVFKHIYEFKKIYPCYIYWHIKQMKNIGRLIHGILKKDKNKIKYQLYCYYGKKHGKNEWKKRYL